MRRIGIVILNYNTYEDTIKCVKSIMSCEPQYRDYYIYIVDNGSPDGSGQRLAETLSSYDERHSRSSPVLKMLFSQKNLGFSGGNNIGIRQALADGCEYIFLLNSDILLINDAITQMAAVFEKYEDVVVVGPVIFYPGGEIGKGFFYHLTLVGRIFGKGKAQEVCEEDGNLVSSGMVNGCCFGLRREFIESQRLLDDHIFLYYEENALASTIIDVGKKGCVCTGAQVFHVGCVSTTKAAERPSRVVAYRRLYAWSSFLYVLRKYSGANRAVCSMLAALFLCIYGWKSVYRQEYRKLFRKFWAEIQRTLEAAE